MPRSARSAAITLCRVRSALRGCFTIAFSPEFPRTCLRAAAAIDLALPCRSGANASPAESSRADTARRACKADVTFQSAFRAEPRGLDRNVRGRSNVMRGRRLARSIGVQRAVPRLHFQGLRPFPASLSVAVVLLGWSGQAGAQGRPGLDALADREAIGNIAHYPSRPLCDALPGLRHCMAKVRVDENGVIRRTDAAPKSGPGAYGPADLQAAYGLPQGDGRRGQDRRRHRRERLPERRVGSRHVPPPTTACPRARARARHRASRKSRRTAARATPAPEAATTRRARRRSTSRW